MLSCRGTAFAKPKVFNRRGDCRYIFGTHFVGWVLMSPEIEQVVKTCVGIARAKAVLDESHKLFEVSFDCRHGFC
jgi:hypothetical protein